VGSGFKVHDGVAAVGIVISFLLNRGSPELQQTLFLTVIPVLSAFPPLNKGAIDFPEH